MLNASTLNQFYGTEQWHRWSPLFPNGYLTDGALYVAEHGGVSGSFWLMDAIGSYQPEIRNPNLRQKNGEFTIRAKVGDEVWEDLQNLQFWKLTVKDKKATLTMSDGNGHTPITQEIEYTDFDLPEIELYVGPMDEKRWCICLPQER
jgi:hypothetical protein